VPGAGHLACFRFFTVFWLLPVRRLVSIICVVAVDDFVGAIGLGVYIGSVGIGVAVGNAVSAGGFTLATAAVAPTAATPATLSRLIAFTTALACRMKLVAGGWPVVAGVVGGWRINGIVDRLGNIRVVTGDVTLWLLLALLWMLLLLRLIFAASTASTAPPSAATATIPSISAIVAIVQRLRRIAERFDGLIHVDHVA
jgi:hypothetical protein